MRQRVLAAIGLMLVTVQASAQTRTDIHPGRVDIRSTAADALIVRGGINVGVQSMVTSNDPLIYTLESDAGADEKKWRWLAFQGDLFLQTENDAGSVVNTAAQFVRVGDTAKQFAFGGTTTVDTIFRVTGSLTAGTSAAVGLKNEPTLTGLAGSNIAGLWNSPTIVEASSGTHALMMGALFSEPTITAGAASVTTAATVYISGAPAASGAANFALYVAAGQTAFPSGTAAAPAISFTSSTNLGLYRTSGGELGFAYAGTQIASIQAASFTLNAGAFGTGGIPGGRLIIGRNSSGAGAPGQVQMDAKDGTALFLFYDSTGNLRGNNAAVTESGGDTVGTVIGTQTSTWESKDILGRETDGAGALAELLQTPVYRFSYKSGAYSGQQFVGITTRTSPLFGMDQGKSFNPVTSFGVTVLAIQELERRVRALEAQR